MSKIGKKIVSLFEPVEADRVNIERIWADVSHLINPSMSTDEGGTRGRDRSVRMFDNTAREAHSRFVNLLFNTGTPLQTQWLVLQPMGRDRETPEESQWLDDAAAMAMAIFRSPNSGFGSAIAECYSSISSFGICSMFTHFDGILRYRSLTPQEIYPVQDENGKLDTIYRKKMWTPLQAAMIFGKESLPPGLRRNMNSASSQIQDNEYIHVVMPSQQARMLDIEMPPEHRDKKYASVYIHRSSSHPVRVSGFFQNPYSTGRWQLNSGEIYGTSPGINVIDEIRSSQVMRESIIRTGQKIADPSYLVEDGSVLGRLRSNAAGVTTIRRGATIGTLPTGDPRAIIDQVEDVRNFIRRAYFEDISNLPLQDRMTATEVIERRNDQLKSLASHSARMHEELIGPTASNTIDHALRTGALRPPPESLIRSNIDFEYVSPLAISQRSSRIQSFDVWIGKLLSMAQVSPDSAAEIFDHVDLEEAPRALSSDLNVPEKYVRSPEGVAARREARSQQAQVQNVLGAGAQAAEVAKTVAETDAIAGRISA